MAIGERVALMMAGVSIVGTTAIVRVNRDIRSIYCAGMSVQQIVDAAAKMQTA